MKKLTTTLLTTILVVLTGCSFSFNMGNQVSVDEIDDPEPTPDTITEYLPTNSQNTEWSKIEETEETITFHAEIENPTSGIMLSSYLVIPNTENEERFKTVMLIPGGTGFGTNAYKEDNLTSNILTKNDIAYAFFDPDGRGESDGEEDANGFIHQDGLFAVSLALASNPFVNTDELGILSMSYGTTLAAGMLGRYPEEQPYKWYIDWEGPSAREYTTVGCKPNQNIDKSLNIECTDEEFWAERESVTFLEKIEIPYLRLQTAKDHVQASNEHAIDAINAATNGSSPWARLNKEAENQTYTYENQPTYPEKIMETDYILEMFELF